METGRKLKALEGQLLEQKEDLIDIRNEVLNFQNAFTRSFGTIGKSVAGLKEEKAENARTLRFLKQNTEDKGKVEKDLRAGIAEKQVEIQRLSSELSKARQAEKSSTEKLKVQQQKNAEVERKMEQSARKETEALRRLSISETSSSSRKEVMSLSSLVEANKVEVERLREELELQSKSHSLRIAELQESFQAKIRELRRVHGEQMASSRSKLEDEIRNKLASEAGASVSTLTEERLQMSKEIDCLKAELDELKRHTSGVEQKLDNVQTKEADARKRVYMLEKQNRTLKAEVDEFKAKPDISKDYSKLEMENKSLNAQLAEVKDELDKKMNESQKAGDQKEDLSMVNIMEQQLVKLSNLLSSKEDEIEALKLTVERECLERGNLIAQLSKLSKTLSK